MRAGVSIWALTSLFPSFACSESEFQNVVLVAKYEAEREKKTFKCGETGRDGELRYCPSFSSSRGTSVFLRRETHSS